MKRISPLVVILTLISMSLSPGWSQPYYTAAEVNYGPTFQDIGTVPPIIKPWNSQYAVEVHRDATTTRIAIVDYQSVKSTALPAPTPPSFPTRYIDLPASVCINDFTIQNNVMYYCGYYSPNSSTQQGLVGTLYLSAVGVAGTTVTLTQHYLEDDLNLRRIIVRLKRGTVAMNYALLGEKMNTTTHTLSSMLIEFQIPSPLGMVYTRFDLGNQEGIEDMIAVGGNIVTLGHSYTGTPNEICLRKCSIDNMLGAGTTVFTSYSYPSGASEPNHGIYGTPISSDAFAAAYIFEDAGGNKRIRVRNFYLPTMANTQSIQFNVTDKGEPFSLSYLPKANILALLQPRNDSADLFLIPPVAPFGNNVRRHTFGDKSYRSVSCVWNANPSGTSTQEVLALSSGDSWFWFHAYYTSAPLFGVPTTTCSPRTTRTFSLIANLGVVSNTSSTLPTIPIYTTSTLTVPVMYLSPAASCTSR